MNHPTANPKWTLPEGTPLARMTREAVFARIEENAAALGDEKWADVVSARWQELFSQEDGDQIAADIFKRFKEEEGRPFYAGCEIAVIEHPDLYVSRSEEATILSPDDFPEGVVGDGDNAFQAEDVTGKIMIVREVSEVDRLITEGVPEGVIGVIDDAGGTMTAPILPDFEAVICLAGTVRSHLAIIAREFGVPTLMNVRLARHLNDGETVTVNYSIEAQNVEAYFGEDLRERAVIRPEAGV
ncbi:MAG: PEP-utilizing enzyme [Solirubrobacterales bacterium]